MEEFFEMRSKYPNVCLFLVDTSKRDDIRDKYADNGPKPYLKFYQNGSKIDEVPYKPNEAYEAQKQKVMDALSWHNGWWRSGVSY